MSEKAKQNEHEGSMPIVEHLRELRRRLLVSVLTLLIMWGVCYQFTGEIYQFLAQPLLQTGSGEAKRLIFTGLTEAFFSYLKLAFYTAFIISFPVIVFQLYRFLAPALYKKEKRVMLPFMFAAPILFILGGAMAYYGVFPLAWKFFLGFESSATSGIAVELEARISEYLSLVTGLIMAFGLAFQMPVIIMLLAKAGFITVGSLKAKRKYAIIGMFGLSAIITPPDVISQVGLALPLIILYELAILGASLMEKRSQNA